MNNTGVVGTGDLKEQLKLVNGLVPAVFNATAGGIAIDRQGFNSILFAIAGGAVVGAGSVTPKLQHSDTTTDGDFVDVVAADIQWGDLTVTALAASADYRQLSADCRRLKRYVRIYFTLTGTSIILAVTATLGAADSLPTA